ncbi:hypothetical protein WME95_19095 [Sorangium sp. So ce327]|uniref:hypothetical protein n=1 Tax=Sorangium sp. So ce327 TaxID=3133301 RepID=UPI003F5FDEE1
MRPAGGRFAPSAGRFEALAHVVAFFLVHRLEHEVVEEEHEVVEEEHEVVEEEQIDGRESDHLGVA